VRVAVWDLPVRLFHWALAVLVVFSFVTGKLGGNWMQWHVKSGCCILALLLFRLAWGVVGSSSARFAGFVRGPRAAIDYARTLLARRPVAHAGHNPLGGWMVMAMLAMLLVQTGSGLFADDEIMTQGPLSVKASSAVVARMNWIHEFNKWLIVGAVALHVAAIATYQWGLKVNLVGPMVHGSGTLDPSVPAPRLGSSVLAAILLALSGAAVYWLVAVFPKLP
jgi:cytochrome b